MLHRTTLVVAVELPEGTTVQRSSSGEIVAWILENGDVVKPQIAFELSQSSSPLIDEHDLSSEELRERDITYDICAKSILPEAQRYVTITAYGMRVWTADDAEHAREQHVEAIPDEPIFRIGIAGPDLVDAAFVCTMCCGQIPCGEHPDSPIVIPLSDGTKVTLEPCRGCGIPVNESACSNRGCNFSVHDQLCIGGWVSRETDACGCAAPSLPPEAMTSPGTAFADTAPPIPLRGH